MRCHAARTCLDGTFDADRLACLCPEVVSASKCEAYCPPGNAHDLVEGQNICAGDVCYKI